MNTHNYLVRVKDKHWEDIQRVKTLDNCSANSSINEGIRLPLTWLDHKFHHEIKEELNKLDLI